ncbi:hypothetical protein [Streptomyces sp. B1I3]|uniref:hypothetical protein n=1 Tax=Streptomyces sp. B1I3 TaxID=3042264 RepID=UPI00278A5581|nr:hypothetical protein [Streptomyces sp. B1I3]MDQ0797908.1 hypothetical protein [Streptomyces sp. B1I3]
MPVQVFSGAPDLGDGPELDACVQEHRRKRLQELDSRMTDLQRARTSLSDLLGTSTRASRAASSPA